MADLRIGSGRFFERGIDSIVDAPEAPETLLLPDWHVDLEPSALAHQAALAELSVRPELAERWLLAPQRFRAAMEAVLALFARTAESRRYANPRLGKLLDRAARVLADEIELRELLQTYRYALLQG